MIELALTIWGSILTIGALAAAWVRWRGGKTEETAKVWREEAAAWRAKAERMERELADLRRRVERLEAENQVLRELHDSRAEIAALRETVNQSMAELRTLIASR